MCHNAFSMAGGGVCGAVDEGVRRAADVGVRA
jgi:hypothetical protein